MSSVGQNVMKAVSGLFPVKMKRANMEQRGADLDAAAFKDILTENFGTLKDAIGTLSAEEASGQANQLKDRCENSSGLIDCLFSSDSDVDTFTEKIADADADIIMELIGGLKELNICDFD